MARGARRAAGAEGLCAVGAALHEGRAPRAERRRATGRATAEPTRADSIGLVKGGAGGEVVLGKWGTQHAQCWRSRS